MQLWRQPLFKSLRFKLIFGLLVIIIPLVAFMIYLNLYAISVVHNQVAQSNKNLISLYMGQIDRNLEEVDNYLYNLEAQEISLPALELPRSINPDGYSYAKIQLNNKLIKDIPNNKPVDMFFVYSPANQDLLAVTREQLDLNDESMLESDIIRIIKSTGNDKGTDLSEWFIHKSGSRYFLTRIIKYGNVYIGALADTTKLMVPLNLIDLGNNGKALLATEQYEPIAYQAFVQENRIDLNYEGGAYKLSGKESKYLVSGEKSSRGRFSLIAIIPESVVLENLPFLRWIVIFICLGTLILLPLVMLLLRKNFLLPINKIIMAMRKIEAGNLEIRITHRPSVYEFEVMNQSFNRMISQIQELKINVLEETMNHQKAELKHLQLQINPHFFLNSLNIIYNLAQVKDYYLIQEMALCLVDYFRFMFRSNLTFVTVRDEIQHTLNYLRIQEMRFPKNLTYDVSVPDALLDHSLPPLAIQTFVENTIKHAVSMDNRVHIGISVECEEERFLRIRIEDTGRGFPEDVLARLRLGADIGNGEGSHIGIWNVQRRLRLLYSDQAQISFENGAERGAVVVIVIPLQENPEGGTLNAVTDR